MLAKTFRQMLVILERNVRDQRMLWAALWQGFRVPPFAADDIIRQARRYKSKRELTRAIRLVAKADLALRSNPPGKRLILEKLVLDLAGEPKLEAPRADGCRKSCRFRAGLRSPWCCGRMIFFYAGCAGGESPPEPPARCRRYGPGLVVILSVWGLETC